MLSDAESPESQGKGRILAMVGTAHTRVLGQNFATVGIVESRGNLSILAAEDIVENLQNDRNVVVSDVVDWISLLVSVFCER